jgi:hypothetical protein
MLEAALNAKLRTTVEIVVRLFVWAALAVT